MIEEAIRLFKAGKVIAFPTETVYGIGCDALNHSATKRIYNIKQRPIKKHLPLMFSCLQSLIQFTDLTQFQESIIKRFSPGPVTYIVKKNKRLRSFPEKIAVRIPNCRKTLKILRELKNPIVATSLNLSSKKEIINFNQVTEYIRKKVDYIICDNSEIRGKSSTIVDISDDKVKLIRSGALNYNSFLSK